MLDAICTMSARLPEDEDDLGIELCWAPEDELDPEFLLAVLLVEWDPDEDDPAWWWLPELVLDDVRSKVLSGRGPDAMLGLCTWDKISRKSFGAYTGLYQNLAHAFKLIHLF